MGIRVYTKSAGEMYWDDDYGYHWDFCHNGDLVILKGSEVVSVVLSQDILSFKEV